MKHFLIGILATVFFGLYVWLCKAIVDRFGPNGIGVLVFFLIFIFVSIISWLFN